jgi:hypothetical protein
LSAALGGCGAVGTLGLSGPNEEPVLPRNVGSIQVPLDANGAMLTGLARITAEQAEAAALQQVRGTVTAVELENENGNLVYSVEIQTLAGEQDVKVDAGNGQVLFVEANHGTDDGDDDDWGERGR